MRRRADFRAFTSDNVYATWVFDYLYYQWGFNYHVWFSSGPVCAVVGVQAPQGFKQGSILVCLYFSSEAEPVILRCFRVVVYFRGPTFNAMLYLLLLYRAYQIRAVRLFRGMISVSSMIVWVLPIASVVNHQGNSMRRFLRVPIPIFQLSVFVNNRQDVSVAFSPRNVSQDA